jgi:hypothetical protein
MHGVSAPLVVQEFFTQNTGEEAARMLCDLLHSLTWRPLFGEELTFYPDGEIDIHCMYEGR